MFHHSHHVSGWAAVANRLSFSLGFLAAGLLARGISLAFGLLATRLGAAGGALLRGGLMRTGTASLGGTTGGQGHDSRQGEQTHGHFRY